MKTIGTLIDDMMEVVAGKGGWTKATSEFFGDWLAKKSYENFSEPREARNWIGLSGVGKPCDRQKWYIVNQPESGAPLTPETLGNFWWGDMLEAFTISLAMAAGHKVEGLQEPLDVHGIPGSGDCIIDGHVVDVKSASSYGFQKFVYHQLRGYHKTDKEGTKFIPAVEADGFGYISQLSSYLYAYKDDPRVHDKENASFLVVKKDKFKLHLDTYNLKDELAKKEQEIEHTKKAVSGPKPPRGFSDIPDGKSGNRMLDFHCGYCEFKGDCWPKARTFLYSNGPRHLTEVVRPPAEHIREVK